MSDKIVLAMSGGVDSCSAGILLSKLGHEVIGVSMQVWDYKNHGGNSTRATCCSPSDFDDARKIAEKFNFPFYVFDFEESFKENVIDKFVNTYLEGKTPNPCLDCNRKVKFFELRKRAKAFGAGSVATGHYARIKEKADKSLGLYTSKDTEKDQSYFLYALKEDELKETLFPVGDMIKEEVREVLRTEGFSISSKAESQDICFISSNVTDFINKRGGPDRSGEILSKDGEKVGEHRGIYNYTVGQRKGLGGGSRNPLYVIQINSNDNSVVVGGKEDLERSDFYLSNVSFVSNKSSKAPFKSRVKLRYRHSGVDCLVTPVDGARAHVEFLGEWSPVSPGQAGVFYSMEAENDGAIEVLGGGIIE